MASVARLETRVQVVVRTTHQGLRAETSRITTHTTQTRSEILVVADEAEEPENFANEEMTGNDVFCSVREWAMKRGSYRQ